MNRATGTYVISTTLGEPVRAFVPHPLPPARPALPPDLYADLNRQAELALARLAGVSGLVPSVDWLLYSAIRKEALLTSQIEGTQATLTDLFDEEAGFKVSNTDDVEEVSNYLRAFRWTQEQLRKPKGLPISVRLLCEAHSLLLQGAPHRGRGRQGPAPHRGERIRGSLRRGARAPADVAFLARASPPGADRHPVRLVVHRADHRPRVQDLLERGPGAFDRGDQPLREDARRQRGARIGLPRGRRADGAGGGGAVGPRPVAQPARGGGGPTISGGSMALSRCEKISSDTLRIAWSSPRPASMHTTIRSSASGQARLMENWRFFIRLLMKMFGE
mgnify:CR=1 FL=1